MHALLFIVGIVVRAANAADTIVAHFDGVEFNDAFIASLDTAMGYECREFVGDDALMLLVDDARRAVLIDEFEATLVDASVTQRCSARLADYGEHGEFNDTRVRERAHLETYGVEQLPSTTPHEVAASATLRLLLHAGAHQATVGNRTRSQWYAAIVSSVADVCAACTVRDMAVDLVYVDSAPVAELDTIAMHVLDTVAGVCFVEPVFREQLVNLWSSSTAQLPWAIADTSASAADACTTCHPLWAAGVRGQNQLLAISDTGVASTACHFADAGGHSVPVSTSSTPPTDTGHRKLRAVWAAVSGDSSDSNGHGTHTAGTAVGAATGAVAESLYDAHDFDGVAPDARLVVIDASSSSSGGLLIPSPYDTELLRYAYEAGARVHSGSWGIADWSYSDEDRRVDLFCWQRRSFLAVFAAGNSGASRAVGSILSPALAKNALAVGAAMNGFAAFDIASSSVPTYPNDAYAYDWVAEFSSRGGGSVVPWLKPDVLGAGGQYVWSASSASPTSCSNGASTVVGMAGTSMAAPQVAGAALLARQYFMEARYHGAAFEPMGSLLRALLSASTTPTRGVFPQRTMASFDLSGVYAPYGRRALEGHGRVSVAAALPTTNATSLAVLSNENHALTSVGAVDRYCLSVSGGSAPITVALAFTDYPSSLVGGTPALVNDLDLRVYTSSTPTHPNGLSSADHRSTIERTSIVASGTVRIEVEAYRLGFSSQSYSLIVIVDAPNRALTINGLTPRNPSSIAAYSGSATCSATSPPPPPTAPPTASPTRSPTASPTRSPTASPTRSPTASPTPFPTSPPFTFPPTLSPTASPTPLPTSSPSAPCRRSMDAALRELVVEGTVCCRTYADVAETYVSGARQWDPVAERLVRALVAARDQQERGVLLSSMERAAVNAAESFVEAHCAANTSVAFRERAHQHWLSIESINVDMCGGGGAPPPITECSSSADDAATLYCAGAGEYSFDTNRCACAADRHQNGACDALHCSAHGVSVDSARRCECFDGWAGAACNECAPSPLAGLTPLCVGVDERYRPPALMAHTHTLELVETSTVAARVAGTYYDVFTLKADDALPGTGVYDCWCANGATYLRASDYATHGDAVAAALNYLRTREVLRGRAPALQRTDVNDTVSVPPPPPPPPPTPTNSTSDATRFGAIFPAALVASALATTIF